MRIERAVNYIKTLGPGQRLCVWVNGCSKRCNGCVSERLQIIDAQTEVDIDEFFAGFNVQRIDGVTISGGEPFDQAEELLHLVLYFKGRGVKDILIYSGYTLEELQNKKCTSIDAVLSEIAVLIDGPYIRELDCQKNNLKGSENQRIIFLNDDFKQRYMDWIQEERSMQEMTLGNVRLAVGIPDQEFIEKFTKTT